MEDDGAIGTGICPVRWADVTTWPVGQTGSVTPHSPQDVPIRDDSIRLGQLLKLADLVDAGADVKPLMIAGLVSVNGEVETRRGRRLVRGDVVTVEGDHGRPDQAVRVT